VVEEADDAPRPGARRPALLEHVRMNTQEISRPDPVPTLSRQLAGDLRQFKNGWAGGWKAKAWRDRLAKAGVEIEEVFAELEDKDLVRAFRCRFSRTEAFQELVENRYKAEIQSRLRLKGVQGAFAGDLLHDALLALWDKKLDKCDPDNPAEFHNWLFKVVKNMRRDWQRAARRVADRLLRLQNPAAHQDCSSPDPLGYLLAAELLEQIERSLGNMSLLERGAFLLRLQGWSYEQIAQELRRIFGLHVKVSSVYQAVSRAREKIRGDLGP
jgi:RNA polymerase sigma factor (sigma-70 family)